MAPQKYSYTAVVPMKADYYPFGMVLPNKFDAGGTVLIAGSLNPSDYRFGYNGMERDEEVKFAGNSYTTEFRQYDPRLGRWLSLDPLMQQFPWMSPYVAFDNNPVLFVDPLGLAAEGGPDKDKDGNPISSSRPEYDDVGVTRARPTHSKEYKQWFDYNGGINLYNAVSDRLYEGKKNTGATLERAFSGLDERGRINYPQENLDKWRREANQEPFMFFMVCMLQRNQGLILMNWEAFY